MLGVEWSFNTMPMRSIGTLLVTAFLTAMLLGPSAMEACGQAPQQDPSQPKPAAQSIPPIGPTDQDPNADDGSTPALQPDTRPLTGVQESTLGAPELLHSYFVPGLVYSNSVSSTALNQTTGSDWNSTSFIAGNVTLVKEWRHSDLSVNYTGGGFFSTADTNASGNGSSDGYFHQFGLTQAFKWARWELLLLDEFSYLPEAAFGFGAGTGLGEPGVGGGLASGLPGLQTGYQPSQSIFTSVGNRYTNSATAQIAYTINRRSSINVSGSFGILRFVESGSIGTNDSIFSAGYNFAVSKRNTLGVIYRFMEDRYPGNPQAVNDQVVQAAFGRKITGRLALQLFGGPNITNLRVPVGNVTQQVNFAGGATLTYALDSARDTLLVSYNHGTSNGSGVQIGSTLDQVEASLSHRFSRSWVGSFNFGYARNRSLGNPDVVQNSQSFDSYYIGGNLSHPLGRTAKLSLGYSAQIQDSNLPLCPAGTCDTNSTSHRIFGNVSWHSRPFVLR
jgi:hypothetical protein